MGGGDLNMKKSWHPQTMRNIERVWKKEENHAAEQKKIEELQKELEEERAREEMQRYAEDSGAVGKKKDKLDWMYQGMGGMVNREDYLLGKPVDKAIIDVNSGKAEKVEEEGNSSSVGALFESSGVSMAVDMATKVREDPLFAIKKREEQSKKDLLNNPVKMKQLQEMLRKNLGKKEKKKKKEKKHKRSHQDSSDDEDSDDDRRHKHRKRSSSSDRRSSPDKVRRPDGYGLVTTKRHRDQERSPDTREERHSRTAGRDADYDRQSDRHRSRHSDRDSVRRRQSSEHDKNDRHDRTTDRQRDRSTGKYSDRNGDRMSDSHSDRHRRRSRSHSPVRRRGRDRSPSPSRRLRSPQRYRSRSRSPVKYQRRPRSRSPHRRQEQTKKKADPEEMERRRREMMENAKWRDDQRKHRVQQYKSEEEKEKEMEKKSSKDAAFLQPLKLPASVSVEHRIKSKINSIQRTQAALDKNFTKR